MIIRDTQHLVEHAGDIVDDILKVIDKADILEINGDSMLTKTIEDDAMTVTLIVSIKENA